MNHVEVQNVVIYRHGRLQQKVLHRPRQIRQGIKREKSRCGSVDRWNLTAIAERSARAGEIRKWIEDGNSETAEISRAFGRRRYGGISV